MLMECNCSDFEVLRLCGSMKGQHPMFAGAGPSAAAIWAARVELARLEP